MLDPLQPEPLVMPKPTFVIVAVAAAVLVLVVPALAHAQSDDPCLEQLADDADALDRYDALVSDYLEASAASDSPRQVEILDELLGVCDANLRLRVFRANANVALNKCEPALADYRFVLDNADTWPAPDNAADARALAQDAMTRYTAACGDPNASSTDDGSTTTTTDPNASDPNASDPNATDPNAADPNAADPNAPSAGGAEAPASGRSIVLGVGPQGGVGWGKFGEDAEESLFGYGGGVQLFGVFHFVPLFGIGLNVNYGYWLHPDSDNGVDYAGSVPSFGVLARFAAGGFVGTLWANYFTGTLELSGDEAAFDIEFDLGGFEVGLAPMAHISLGETFGIDVGGFAALRTGTASIDASLFEPGVAGEAEDDVRQITIGATALAVFEIGL